MLHFFEAFTTLSIFLRLSKLRLYLKITKRLEQQLLTFFSLCPLPETLNTSDPLRLWLPG